jgi:hypothetical protein
MCSEAASGVYSGAAHRERVRALLAKAGDPVVN